MNISTFDIKSKFVEFDEECVIHSFLGILNDEILDRQMTVLEGDLLDGFESKALKKKVFHIFIEVLQNLKNYKPAHDFKPPHEHFFIIIKDCKNYVSVISGNFILKKHVDGVRSRIDLVNYMGEDEVKELYRGILDYGGVSDGGGAGLGFVDLAKRSGQKLNYEFIDVNDSVSFFTLTITINKA